MPMQIVIEIDEKYYKFIKELVENFDYNYTPWNLIANGTPLPKGHRRLIDADELYENTEICHSDEDGYACVRWKDINDAPTIIEGSESE